MDVVRENVPSVGCKWRHSMWEEHLESGGLWEHSAQAVEADVLMMQETRVTEDEWLAVEGRAAQLGHCVYRLAEALTEDGGERLACQAE